MNPLAAAFAALTSPNEDGETYAVREIQGKPWMRVGMSATGEAALLVKTRQDQAGRPVGTLELPHVNFRPRCSCRLVLEPGQSRDEVASVLLCRGNDTVLLEYFWRVAWGTLEELTAQPTDGELQHAVSSLFELFRAFDLPARTTLQGIWCELLLVARAHSKRQAVRAWHGQPGDIYDFSAGQQRVEVKSTTRPLRSHKFSLAQLSPPADLSVFIASFVLEESNEGVSIQDLWDDLAREERLSLELRRRVATILASSLGRDWRDARRVRYDPSLAWRQMRVYRAEDVPRVGLDLPPEVTEVRFRSELTSAPSMDPVRASEEGGLLAALFGR